MYVDKGDVVGSLVTVVGVGIILFWPRDSEGEGEELSGDSSSSASSDMAASSDVELSSYDTSLL